MNRALNHVAFAGAAVTCGAVGSLYISHMFGRALSKGAMDGISGVPPYKNSELDTDPENHRLKRGRRSNLTRSQMQAMADDFLKKKPTKDWWFGGEGRDRNDAYGAAARVARECRKRGVLVTCEDAYLEWQEAMDKVEV